MTEKEKRELEELENGAQGKEPVEFSDKDFSYIDAALKRLREEKEAEKRREAEAEAEAEAEDWAEAGAEPIPEEGPLDKAIEFLSEREDAEAARIAKRRELAGEIAASKFDPSDSTREGRDKLYSSAADLGVTSSQVDEFARKAAQWRDVKETGRARTEYGTVGDGTYYQKRDAEAIARNRANAGNRGATDTLGLDRQTNIQNTPTGATRVMGRDSRRSLESERGRARREARAAARANMRYAANQRYADSVGTNEPVNKDEDYRRKEEQRKRDLVDAQRRNQQDAKSYTDSKTKSPSTPTY